MRRAKSKTLKKSSLTSIRGIGDAKAKKLMSHFGTLAALADATADDIAEVDGISADNAKDIYAFLHEGEM